MSEESGRGTFQEIQKNGQYDTAGAFSETRFGNLQKCPLVTINYFHEMCPMSDHDYYASYTIHCGTFGGDDD